MEFWASEVKSGETFKVQPGDGMVLHLSQANLGEIKKDKGESVSLFVNVDGKKLVLGTLFSDKLPQQQLDLVFDRDFELSHNWKNGSVFFHGYLATNPVDDEEGHEFSDSDESDEDTPVAVQNGKPVAKATDEKPADAKKAKVEKVSAVGRPKVKIVEPSPSAIKKEEDDETDDDSMSSDDDASMDALVGEDSDDSEGDSDSDDSDEETPKKADTGKKRAADSVIVTPVPEKKAKVVTPQKTDGKKGGGHVATPHPSKQAAKTPANKSQQSPKSAAGSHTCKSCTKSFGSEKALESHSKAKHSAGK